MTNFSPDDKSVWMKIAAWQKSLYEQTKCFVTSERNISFVIIFGFEYEESWLKVQDYIVCYQSSISAVCLDFSMSRMSNNVLIASFAIDRKALLYILFDMPEFVFAGETSVSFTLFNNSCISCSICSELNVLSKRDHTFF